MPELPEVETIRSGLKDQVIGRRIEDVKVLNPGSLKTPMDIVGRKIQDVQRRAKVLILHLDKQSLLIHLKMTGQVIVDTPKGRIAGGHPTKSMQAELPDRSTRVIFSLDKGMTMYFND